MEDDDDYEPPFSVRRLRQAYLDRVRGSNSTGLPPPRRITPLAASVTPSLPFIPEDEDEERRLTKSHRTTSETALNKPSGEKTRALRFEPPPPPKQPYSLPPQHEKPIASARQADKSHIPPSVIAVNVTTTAVTNEQQQSASTVRSRLSTSFRTSETVLCNGGPDYGQREMTDSRASFADSRALSASEAELTQIKLHVVLQDSVVIWPPLVEKKPRSQSVMARSITGAISYLSITENQYIAVIINISIADPERINEYRRQKQMEEEAMRRHEEEKMRAMQVQQQRLYEQRHGVTSPVQFIDVVDSAQYPPQQQYLARHPTRSPAPDHMSPDYGYDPHRMRVYETRPISALSEMSDTGLHNTWKRTYVVQKPEEVAKNEILNSEQLLEKDQYDVDLLKRRAAFVEKPEEKPEIIRTGRRWQPPPEKPYVWPSFPRAASVDISVSHNDQNTGYPRSADNAEYHWAPIVTDPGYKTERKNFTPTNSPPLSPRRGHGTGPLDEVAKRQTKYVIQPSPDGSHRPKPAFRKERKAPSGGFYPHAPNAVKVVKRRPASAQGLLAPVDGTTQENVEIIHQRNFHKLARGAAPADFHYHQQGYRDSPQDADRNERRSLGRSEPNVNDWEKIYDLPPHSSTIVGKDVPTNIDVKRRLSQFQGSVQSLQRRQESAHRSYSMDGRRQHQEYPSTSGQNSRSPSTLPVSPASRADTPTAIRVRTKMGQVTAPGPSPKSYDRARSYVPRPLPPGYRLGDPMPDPRAVSPAPGHTKRMIRSMAESTQRLDPNNFQPIRDRRLSPSSQYL
ncbi:hypothetical protein ANCCEY_04705 [Ancylostoma ceylanicum]|uniref:Uncharacterized protein n=1 Tax=Ancylostoma ceylanicum TaxID=53326 RepID=A0A0D6M8L6_9BILA|nr:hypothetical protein ANCCEY_04705 [Ancylostoma ceylanicum]